MNLEVKTMVVKFGDSDRIFRATTEDGFNPAQEADAPTVIGDTSAVVVPGDAGTAAVFPGGLDIGSLGIAVPQLTIGSVSGTQAVLRYIALNTGDAEIGDLSLMGFGLRHSLSQYWSNAPVDLAAGFLWQKFKLGDELVDATATNLGVQASKQFSILEPYVGLSYDLFSMSVKYESRATDPPTTLDVDFDSTTSAHLTAGLGLNLAVVHLHGEVNVASQTSYLLGLSLGN